MSNRSNLLFAFAAGAAVGAAIVALMSTDKGKDMVNKAKSRIDDLADNLSEKMGDLEQELRDVLNKKEEGKNPSV